MLSAVTIGIAAAALLPAADGATPSPSADAVQTANEHADRLRRQLIAERRSHATALRRRVAAERTRARRAVRRARTASGQTGIERIIRASALAYGQSPDRMVRVARCESRLHPEAVNGRYLGLFQFGAPLWSRTPFRAFPRTDPHAASLAAAWAFSRGLASHWPLCGRR